MSNFNVAKWYAIFAGSAIKGMAVLCVAWVLAFLLRRRSASARHLLWTATSAVLLALPFLTMSLPALYVPFTGSFSAPSATFQTSVLAPGIRPAGQVASHTSQACSSETSSPSRLAFGPAVSLDTWGDRDTCAGTGRLGDHLAYAAPGRVFRGRQRQRS